MHGRVIDYQTGSFTISATKHLEASPVIVLQEALKKGITPYTTSTGVNHDYDHQLRLLTHKVPIYTYKSEDVEEILSKTLFYFLISSTRVLTTPDGSPKTLSLIFFFFFFFFFLFYSPKIWF